MIDSHAHLTSADLLPDVERILERATLAGVSKIVNICTDEASLAAGLILARRYPILVNTAATTPHDVEKEGESFFLIVKRDVKELVAIGETGLDYFYEHSNRKVQREFLSRYLELATSSSLPVIFHCRDAFEDLFSICDGEYKGHPAVLHCFTGSLEEAKEVIDRGWYLSFSGIITFKKSEALREVVRYAPLDRIFIETDSPYLAPQGNRGKTNEPAFIRETAEKIAEVKKVPVESVIQMTEANAAQFFSLK